MAEVFIGEEENDHFSLMVLMRKNKIDEDALDVLIHCPEQTKKPASQRVVTPVAGLIFNVKEDQTLPRNSIALTEIQLKNARLVSDNIEPTPGWRWLRPGNLLDVDHVTCSVRTRIRQSVVEPTSLVDFEKALAKHCFSYMLTKAMKLLVRFRSVDYVVTVDELFAVQDGDGDGDDDDNGPSLDPHIFRGQVGPMTKFHVSGTPGDQAFVNDNIIFDPAVQLHSSSAFIRLRTLHDDEEFVVRRKLLLPCLQWLPSVRDKGTREIQVDSSISSLTLDRVLRWLESTATGNTDFQLSLGNSQELLAAAEQIGMNTLKAACEEKLGTFNRSIRVISFDEVRAAWDEQRRYWIVIDYAVFDVTEFLHVHPGGDRIIPEQAKFRESTVFFELYHSTRESFALLKEFYVGELAEQDYHQLTIPPEKPSPSFIHHLREHTKYRLSTPTTHKSF